MSATVLMDPAVELYFATGERALPRSGATSCWSRRTRDPELALLQRRRWPAPMRPRSRPARPISCAGTWSGWPSCIARPATRRPASAVERLWRSIREHHLTLGGGPWGGVAHRSREVFNRAGRVQPARLRRDLLDPGVDPAEPRAARDHRRRRATPRRSSARAYNDLLGAQAPNGEDWCYYVVPERPPRAHDLLALLQVQRRDGARGAAGARLRAYRRRATAAVNMFGPGRADDRTGCGRPRAPGAGNRAIRSTARRAIARRAASARRASRLRVRVPSWAEGATRARSTANRPAPRSSRRTTPCSSANGAPATWSSLQLPMRAAQSPRDPPQRAGVARARRQRRCARKCCTTNTWRITRGPLVYATGLIDGFKTEETMRCPRRRKRTG